MKNEMDWFSRYWELDPHERREFLEYARDNDEIRPEVESIERFEGALESATRIVSDPLSDESLLFYADRDGLDKTDPGTARAINLIEDALRGNAEASKRLEVLERRMKLFDAAVPEVGSAFAEPSTTEPSTSGSDLRDTQHMPNPANTFESGSRTGTTTAEKASLYNLTGRKLLVSVVSPLRHVASSVVTAAAVYLILFLFSFMISPRETRLAYLSTDDAAVELLLSTERGELLHPELVSSILEAASMLRGAQVSTLGLFPRYDDARLRDAAVALETLYDDNLPAELAPYAAYFMGKLYLAQGDVYNARLVLRTAAAAANGSIDFVVEDLLYRIES